MKVPCNLKLFFIFFSSTNYYILEVVYEQDISKTLEHHQLIIFSNYSGIQNSGDRIQMEIAFYEN